MSKRSLLAAPARFLLPALLVLGLGGCQTAGIDDVTGALGAKSEPVGRADTK